MLLTALWCPLATGQTFYGSVSGSVLDATGGAIPGVAVTLTNLGTSDKRTMESDATGSYTFVNLVPGSYRLEAEKSGFKHFTREPIVVEVQNALRIDVLMVIGAVTQSVEVTAATPLLQSQSSDLGQVVESRTVTEMPLNGRNPIALVQLAPGVVPQGPPAAGNSSLSNPVGANPFGAGDFQIGGGQAGQNAILLDGVPTNGSYLNVVTVIPTQDALQEFKVQTNNLGPEFGRFAGGVINFTTKSGTNQWHGAAYEFNRNKALNANDFFLNKAGLPVPPYTQNQFGGNVGGKILTDKLFSFASYEGYRRRSSSAFTSTVPTDLMKSGDFSEWAQASGAQTIYDPLTSSNCVAGGAACRTQIGAPTDPGGSGTLNMLAPGQINAAAKAMLTYFPPPTNNQLINNFVTAYATGGDTNQFNERTDWNVSDRQRIFGRFTYYNLLNLPDSPFKDICTDRCTETVHAKQIALGDTYSFSPTTILDLHIGYTRYVYLRTPLTSGFDFSSLGGAWGSYAFTLKPIPTVNVTNNYGGFGWNGGWGSQGAGSEIGAHDDTWSLAPSLTKIKGRHTLKVGWEGRLLRNNYYQSNIPSGFFTFDNTMTTANPFNALALNGLNTGLGFASFLMGYGASGNVTTPSLMASQMIYNGWYAGDTFQVSPKLTLNLGVRYDLQGFFTERFDRELDFQGNLASPLAGMTNPSNGLVIPSGLKGALPLVDTPASPGRADENTPTKEFSPRIGLAYRWTDKTVIRAGYGIFYLPNDVRWNDAPHNLFINTYVQNWVTTDATGMFPLNTFSNPFPGGIVLPPGRSQAFINVQGNPSAPSLNNPEGYAQQWNLNIQRELPDGTFVELAYAGAKGTHLPMHSQDIDQLPDSLLPTSAAGVAPLVALVPNPYYGIVQGALTTPTVKAGQFMLPFPQYGDVSLAEPNDRDSEYESAQITLRRHMRGGGNILASYTISKLISDTNNEINWLGDAAPSWGDTDANNLHNERSLDGFDVPQRFVLGYVLDAPFGHGKKWGNSLSPAANKLASGWGIDGILTLQKGFPLEIGGGSNALCSAGIPNAGGCRVTRIGTDSMTSGSTATKLNDWFDTSVFTNTTSFTRGNDSRVEPALREDGEKNMDFAIFKDTKFGPDERMGLEFRAEFFNVFNHPQFSAPNTGCCTSYANGGQFGVVTSQYNLPRLVQFGLRLTF